MSFWSKFLKPDDGSSMESMDTMGSWRNKSTTLVDLRKKPRYDTMFSGSVLSENGGKIPCTISNISKSGLRIEGNQPDLFRLMPNMDNGSHTPTPLEVTFSLPGPANKTCAIQVLCESVYVILGSYRDFKIGIKITAFDRGKEAFLEYISFRAYGR